MICFWHSTTYILVWTYDRSSGVAGCGPPIVCAKLLVGVPLCLDWAFWSPGTPFVVVPKPQPVPFPYSPVSLSEPRYSNPHEFAPNLVVCNLPVPSAVFGFWGARWPGKPGKARNCCGVGPTRDFDGSVSARALVPASTPAYVARGPLGMVLDVKVPRLIDTARLVTGLASSLDTNSVEGIIFDRFSSGANSSGEVENLMGPQSCSSSRAEPIWSAQE